MKTDVIILGGGASGLFAAAALAPSGLSVTLVERLDRVGKKIMASGNGRCNLSNTDLSPAHYGEAASFASRVFEAAPDHEIASRFARMGLMTACEDGRVYPRTMMASSVLDVLRTACDAENVRLLTGTQALSLQPSRRGGWSVELDDGSGLFAPTVLCAMGGSAAPSMGTDGSGTKLLSELGHRITPLYPALVQLRCSHPALRSLKGIRTHVLLTLEIDGTCAAQEEGELLFADYGVSGVCVFQLSRRVSPALGEGRRVRLLINLLPEETNGARWLHSRISMMPDCPLQSLFTGVFARLLSQAILRQAHLEPDRMAASLNADELHALECAVFSFPLDVTGTQGFSSAQVTRGGVHLDDVDPSTMASRLYDGLYICGETLDVDGPCGGYNLHFAFASALCAAQDILRRKK